MMSTPLFYWRKYARCDSCSSSWPNPRSPSVMPRLRDELRKIVGTSQKKQESVYLMDGSRTQKQIQDQTSVHQGDLSTMVGKLESAGLLADGKKQPKLAISIPSNFFDANAKPK